MTTIQNRKIIAKFDKDMKKRSQVLKFFFKKSIQILIVKKSTFFFIKQRNTIKDLERARTLNNKSAYIKTKEGVNNP